MHPNPAPAFEALHALGERMRASLEAGDLELFVTLTAERGTLLDSLSRTSPRITPDLQDVAAALAAQQRGLVEAAAAQERRLEEALVELERFKSAHQHYRQPRPGAGILNENLTV